MKKKSSNNLKNFIILLLVIVVIVLLAKNIKPTTITNKAPTTPSPTPAATATPITIESKDIKEENFTGKEPVITGSGELAAEARAYVAKTVTEFKTQADTDVPDMKAKFGADSPPATYTIDMEAKYQKGTKTDSIIISSYMYTGGANGNSSYKVVTANHATGKVLSLSSVIKSDKQVAFTSYVKTKLINWRPEGSDASVVFPDAVGGLKFSSFTNWSMDGTNLTIYFDKYEIGPGVLGAVAFPLPLDKIKDYLVPAYI